MKTLIINLKRAHERRAYMNTQLSRTGLDYEFLEATDGTLVDHTDPALLSSYWDGRTISVSPGILGCALSHLHAYRKALESGAPHLLVLEDDVVIPTNIQALAEEAATHMCLAEVILLQVSCLQPPCRLSRSNTVALSSGHVLAYPTSLAGLTGAGAYLITAEGCRNMTSRLLPVHTEADDWDYFLSHGILKRVRCLSPVAVTVNRKFPSLIDHGSYSWRDPVYKALDRVPIAPIKGLLTLRRKRLHRHDTTFEFVEEPPSMVEYQD